MSRRGVLVAVVTLAVLAGGAVVADGVARSSVEAEIADRVGADVIAASSRPEVSIGGGAFLPQLVGRSLDEVSLTAPAGRLDGLDVEDVSVVLNGVSVQEPYVADAFTLSAFVPLASVKKGARDAGAGDLDLSIANSKLVLSTKVLGAEVSLVLAPRAKGRDVLVSVESIRAAGLTLSAESLPTVISEQIKSIRVPIEGLPDGVDLSSVTVVEGGLAITAKGTDVSFGG